LQFGFAFFPIVFVALHDWQKMLKAPSLFWAFFLLLSGWLHFVHVKPRFIKLNFSAIWKQTESIRWHSVLSAMKTRQSLAKRVLRCGNGMAHEAIQVSKCTK